jgi:5-methylcytosine-specific restriction endonuclease McrA
MKPHASAKPCRKCGQADREPNGRCGPCHRAGSRAWSKDNRAKANATHRAWTAANREAHLAVVRAYRKKHSDKVSARGRAYRSANPIGRALAQVRRKARKLAAPGSGVSPAQWLQVLQESSGLCVYCNARPEKLTMDHIDPLIGGGAHDIANVVAACQSCNSSKHNRSLLGWLARGGLRNVV